MLDDKANCDTDSDQSRQAHNVLGAADRPPALDASRELQIQSIYNRERLLQSKVHAIRQLLKGGLLAEADKAANDLRSEFPDHLEGYKLGIQIKRAQHDTEGVANLIAALADKALDTHIQDQHSKPRGVTHVSDNLPSAGNRTHSRTDGIPTREDLAREKTSFITQLINRKMWAEADEAASRFRTEFPINLDGYRLGVQIKRALEDTTAVADIIRVMNFHLPIKDGALRITAEDAMVRREWRQADLMWERYRTLFPDDMNGYSDGAKAIRAQGDNDRADAVLLGGMSRLSNDARLAHAYLEPAIRRRDRFEVAKRWQECLRYQPDVTSHWLAASRAVAKSANKYEAEKLLEKGFARLSSEPLAAEHARLALARYDFATAINRYNVALEGFPDSLKITIGLIEALSSAGYHHQAEMTLTGAELRFPGAPDLVLECAKSAFRKGDFALSAAKWTEAGQKYPDIKFLDHRAYEAGLLAGLAEFSPTSDVEQYDLSVTPLRLLAGLSLGQRLVAGPPPSDSVTPAWRKEVVDALRKAVDDHEEGTPPHMAAAIVLEAVAGNHQAARELIGQLVDNYADKYPHDTPFFRYLLFAAFDASQWDVVKRLLCARYCDDWCGGIYLNSVKRGILSVKWSVDGSYKTHLCLDKSMFEHVPAGLYWVESVDLFYSYTRKCPNVEQGMVELGMGDFGHVPGLAPSEHRREYFLVPDRHFINTRGYEDLRQFASTAPLPWDARKPIAFWRGNTMGKVPVDWREMPRLKLCLMARAPQNRSLIDAAVTGFHGLAPDVKREVEAAELIGPYVPQSEFPNYKYQVDIDGFSNAWSGLFYKLLTGSVVLKVNSAAGYRQWYYDDLLPWRNYVPVAADLSDLVEKLCWLRDHDDYARRIGEEGRALALSLTFEGELVRSHAVINAAMRYCAGRPEVVIPFLPGLPEERYLVSGWSGPVTTGDCCGRHALAPESHIHFPRPVTNGDMTLQLSLASCGTAPIRPFRMIAVVNGAVVIDDVITGPVESTCLVDAKTLEAATQTHVTVLFPDLVTSPNDFPAEQPATDLIFTKIQLESAKTADRSG